LACSQPDGAFARTSRFRRHFHLKHYQYYVTLSFFVLYYLIYYYYYLVTVGLISTCLENSRRKRDIYSICHARELCFFSLSFSYKVSLPT